MGLQHSVSPQNRDPNQPVSYCRHSFLSGAFVHGQVRLLFRSVRSHGKGKRKTWITFRPLLPRSAVQRNEHGKHINKNVQFMEENVLKIIPKACAKNSDDHQGKPFPFSSHWETEKGSEIQDSNFQKERVSPGGPRRSLILKSSRSQVFPRSAHRSCNNHGAKCPGSTLP